MEFLRKYGMAFYFGITLLYKLNFIIPMASFSIFYYLIMSIGLIIMLPKYKGRFVGYYVKYFKYIYIIVGFNLIYLVVFGFNKESTLYWFAKLASSNLIMFSIISNISFYEKLFYKYFKYVLITLIGIGYLFGAVDEISAGDVNRLGMGFNPNDLGLFAALGVLSIMLFNRAWYKKKVDFVLFAVFCLLTLMSGSKAALLNLVIGVILIYGFNARIFIFALLLILVFLITPQLGYTTSIDRLLSKENVFETRNEVFEIGVQTFNDAFWTGHGLDKYGWTDPSYWPSPELALGPHNTYLSIGIMYGAIFGFIFIFLLLIQLVKAIKIFFKNKSPFVKFSALMIILCIINGFFESLIVGVNEFITVLFWFSIGVVSFAWSTGKSLKIKKRQYGYSN